MSTKLTYLPYLVARRAMQGSISFHVTNARGYNKRTKQLSYRKQIARQLRTQYVEGTHRHKYYTVTF